MDVTPTSPQDPGSPIQGSIQSYKTFIKPTWMPTPATLQDPHFFYFNEVCDKTYFKPPWMSHLPHPKIQGLLLQGSIQSYKTFIKPTWMPTPATLQDPHFFYFNDRVIRPISNHHGCHTYLTPRSRVSYFKKYTEL